MIRVYKITNLVNGKAYFGITGKTVAGRWSQHQFAARTGARTGAMQGAILKYGADAFEIEEVYRAVDSREAIAVERGLIAAYGSMWPSGYNMSTGGELRTGHKVSPATKDKMRAAAIGREIGPAQRSAASNRMKQLWTDPEYRAAYARWLTTPEGQDVLRQNGERSANERRGKPGFFLGRTHSRETREVLSEKGKGREPPNKGIAMSAGQKEKLSAAKRGVKQSAEHIERRREGMNTPVAKAKRSGNMKARWSDPESRARMLANRTYPPKPPLTEEQRAARSEQMTRVMAERKLRRKETDEFGPSTAAVRALGRKLPCEMIPRVTAYGVPHGR